MSRNDWDTAMAAHNPEVEGSNPSPATTNEQGVRPSPPSAAEWPLGEGWGAAGRVRGGGPAGRMDGHDPGSLGPARVGRQIRMVA
jgi:hypothetical protein